MIRFIDAHRERFGLEAICRTLTWAGTPASASTYYAAKRRPPSARSVRDAELTQEIRRIHQVNYGVYGARKIWRELNRQGHAVARCTVERLMRELGITGAVRGRKVVTTIPDQAAERAPDLLDRDFVATAPNRCWVADFTYVPTWAGTVYVAFCVDAFSRRILGWKASRSKQTSLVLDVVEQALWQRGYRPNEQVSGLIHHSDAGSQYTSIAFTERLAEAGIAASIGTVGDAYDCQSFRTGSRKTGHRRIALIRALRGTKSGRFPRASRSFPRSQVTPCKCRGSRALVRSRVRVTLGAHQFDSGGLQSRRADALRNTANSALGPRSAGSAGVVVLVNALPRAAPGRGAGRAPARCAQWGHLGASTSAPPWSTVPPASALGWEPGAHLCGHVCHRAPGLETLDQEPPAVNGQSGIAVGHEDLRAVQS